MRLLSSIIWDGLMPLIRKALWAEDDSGSSLGKRYLEMKKEWNFSPLLTLCSMDGKVISELSNSNLVLATQQDLR